VRAIKDVAIAVTEGDLTRTITEEAKGELDELKRNINQMIGNLRGTTEKNQEQDWLKTNLAKFGRMMQGQKDLDSVARLIMSELTPLVGAHHAAFFLGSEEEREVELRLIASYAYKTRKHVANSFRWARGWSVRRRWSGSRSCSPRAGRLHPDQLGARRGAAAQHHGAPDPLRGRGEGGGRAGVVPPLQPIHQLFLDQLAESIGVVLNMIQANMRTEELLQQSQKLTQDLQSQSQELQTQQEELRR
jgi:hypothetical protein